MAESRELYVTIKAKERDWTDLIVGAVLGVTIAPLLVSWATGELHQVFDWLPDLTFVQSLAALILLVPLRRRSLSVRHD